MKWVISTVVTIIFVPKLQPIVSEYIESEFINNVGLGANHVTFTIFSIILLGKVVSKTVDITHFIKEIKLKKKPFRKR